MNTLHDRSLDPDDRTDGPFAPVVKYDVCASVHTFDGTGYHDGSLESEENTDYIVGYDAISDHARERLAEYVDDGNVGSLVTAACIIESFPEHFGEITGAQIDEIVAEVCAVRSQDALYDAIELILHSERLHQGMRQEVAKRIRVIPSLSEINKDPIVICYVDLQRGIHGDSELEVLAALLQDLPKTDK